MWKISDLKIQAKTNLKNKYWKAFLVTLLGLIISGGLTMGGVAARGETNQESMQRIRMFLTTHPGAFAMLIVLIVFVGLIGITVSICYSVYIVFPMQVGQKKYFIQNTQEKPEVGVMLFGFDQNHKNIAHVMFRKYLSIFLWSLLFIIPGIIKAFQYITIEYLLAENPNISYQEATSKSKELTTGHKMHIFGLFFSFIGWFILCGFTFGIGFVFLYPYIEATTAELYNTLKKNSTQS